MKKLFKSKRAAFFDNISVFVWIGIISLILILTIFVLNAVNTAFSASSITPVATTQLDNFTTKYNSLADGSVVLWLIILFIGTCVTAFFVDNYPVFFVVFITLSVVSFFILAPLANVFSSFVADSAFTTIIASMPLTNFILNNLLVFNALFILATGLILYAKFKR
jgi:hypothetical protein